MHNIRSPLQCVDKASREIIVVLQVLREQGAPRERSLSLGNSIASRLMSSSVRWNLQVVAREQPFPRKSMDRFWKTRKWEMKRTSSSTVWSQCSRSRYGAALRGWVPVSEGTFCMLAFAKKGIHSDAEGPRRVTCRREGKNIGRQGGNVVGGD